MEDIYDDCERQKYHLNLIQYYALYDPNGEEGLIQGLRYYPRDINTVIPDNPKLKTTINYYKPYTDPRVVLPKPRYAKKMSSLNKNTNKNNINILDQNNYLNQQNFNNQNMNRIKDNNMINSNIMNNTNNINDNNDCYRTYRRSYSNKKEYEHLN